MREPDTHSQPMYKKEQNADLLDNSCEFVLGLNKRGLVRIGRPFAAPLPFSMLPVSARAHR